MDHNKILNHFSKDVGLLEKIFGKSSDILYNFEFEKSRARLENVYKKTDVDILFPSQLDEDKLKSILDIIFRVPQFGNGEDLEEKKKFLGIF